MHPRSPAATPHVPVRHWQHPPVPLPPTEKLPKSTLKLPPPKQLESALPGAFRSTHALEPDETPHLPWGSCGKLVKQHPVNVCDVSGQPMMHSALGSLPTHGNGF